MLGTDKNDAFAPTHPIVLRDAAVRASSCRVPYAFASMKHIALVLALVIAIVALADGKRKVCSTDAPTKEPKVVRINAATRNDAVRFTPRPYVERFVFGGVVRREKTLCQDRKTKTRQMWRCRLC